MPTFAPMRQQLYCITGVNALTGQREEISRAMPYDMARERLDREIANRKYQRYQPHTRLRIEKRLPTQLTLNFLPYGE